ncbi:hypothetical protein FIBSPDRAFT_316482 [Athelia psychrophila]|uniref:Uncharacterized protein n=1 Tax=Athelia psychrophila TaxID=1759441 RepID=A0A167WYX0_9AGAM|nr:hypothetical protein FIBSPDRAFT_316482 [Fibularhizoctonia sp. CBS 109695]
MPQLKGEIARDPGINSNMLLSRSSRALKVSVYTTMKLETEAPLPLRSPHTASGVTSLPPRFAHTHATAKVQSSTEDDTVIPLPGATRTGQNSEPDAKFQSQTATRAQMPIPECAPEPVSFWLDLYPIDDLLNVPECAPEPPSTSASTFAWIDLQPLGGDEEDIDTPERTPNSPRTPWLDPTAEEEATQAHMPVWCISIPRHLRVVSRRLSTTRVWGRKKP